MGRRFYAFVIISMLTTSMGCLGGDEGKGNKQGMDIKISDFTYNTTASLLIISADFTNHGMPGSVVIVGHVVRGTGKRIEKEQTIHLDTGERKTVVIEFDIEPGESFEYGFEYHSEQPD